MMQLWSPHKGDLSVPGLSAATATNPNGAIDGMPVGSTTPAPGTFSALKASAAGPVIGSANALAAGTTGAPTAITSVVTDVTTADSSHIAVILPTGVAGDARLVYNSGAASAQTIDVFCQSTDKIDGGSAGGNVTLTVAHRAAWFYCVAANTWISALVGAVST